MQFFLLGFIIIEVCEIFSIGHFPLDSGVRRAFSAAHIAAVVATTWILLMNGAVGYQLIDDGTPLSLVLIFGSAAVLFVGTGYIALDTAFSWTGFWDDTLGNPNQAYALYTLYQLVPLVFLVVFFILEAFLVLKVLGEIRPMCKLEPLSYVTALRANLHLVDFIVAAALLFAIGQIFQYVISTHICEGTQGKINGGLFSTLFTLLAVTTIWLFWSSITEDDWPMPTSGGSTYT